MFDGAMKYNASPLVRRGYEYRREPRFSEPFLNRFSFRVLYLIDFQNAGCPDHETVWKRVPSLRG